MDPTVRVRHLTKCYGPKKAIQGLSFDVESGQIVGFLGPNGAGKSTTLRILCGLLPASRGSVFINGFSITRQLKKAKKCLGYMPENNPLPEDMRVEEYLTYRANLKNIPSKRIKASVQEALERCSLNRTAAKKMIGTLSKGFRQRVGIAETFLGNPPLIILDEPTIGLDPHQILGIRDLLKSLQGQSTIIFSSHILPEVEMACSQLIILDKGHMVAKGTSQALRDQHFPSVRYTITVKDPEGSFGTQITQESDFRFHIKSSTKQEKDSVTYVLETDKKLDDTRLTEWIFQHHWPLLRFDRQQANLEALFLKLTSEDWKRQERILG